LTHALHCIYNIYDKLNVVSSHITNNISLRLVYDMNTKQKVKAIYSAGIYTYIQVIQIVEVLHDSQQYKYEVWVSNSVAAAPRRGKKAVG